MVSNERRIDYAPGTVHISAKNGLGSKNWVLVKHTHLVPGAADRLWPVQP